MLFLVAILMLFKKMTPTQFAFSGLFSYPEVVFFLKCYICRQMKPIHFSWLIQRNWWMYFTIDFNSKLSSYLGDRQCKDREVFIHVVNVSWERPMVSGCFIYLLSSFALLTMSFWTRSPGKRICAFLSVSKEELASRSTYLECCWLCWSY